MRLSTVSAAVACVGILCSGSPTGVILAKATTKLESDPNALLDSFSNLPALPETQSISKRTNAPGVSHSIWNNGWTSRSLTYIALLPAIPAATQLALFYTRLSHLCSSFPRSLVASSPTIVNGRHGQMVRFRAGGMEMRFFSYNSMIPWSFVAEVVTKLASSATMGFNGLHGTVFVNEVAGTVVFVTLTAVGVPVPSVWPGLT